MAMTAYGISQYEQAAVKTASRGQLLILLYEAAIRNVTRASAAIERRDVAAKGAAIGKAHAIVDELLFTLDHRVDGEIAANLERLYDFMAEQLVKANLESSTRRLHDVQKLLEILLDGFRGAAERASPPAVSGGRGWTS